MFLLQGSRLRRNMRWRLNPNQTNKEAAIKAEVDKDRLSSLPDELILEILPKLDPESLNNCIAASRRFLPYVSNISKYSAALPSTIVVNGSPRPVKILYKYLWYATGVALVCAPLLYFVLDVVLYRSVYRPVSFLLSRFYSSLLYSGLVLLPAVFPPVRPHLERWCFDILIGFVLECEDVLTHPLSRRLFSMIRYVLFHPITKTTLELVAERVCAVVCITCRLVYSPRVTTSGSRFFDGLKGLTSLEVTLPGKAFGDPELWVRGEKQRIGNTTYEILITGRISNDENYDPINDNGNSNLWVMYACLFKELVRRMYEIIDMQCFVLEFPVSGEVVRVVTIKNGGTNTMIRFDLKESIPTEKKSSFLGRVKVEGKGMLSYTKEKYLKHCGRPEKKIRDVEYDYLARRLGAIKLEEGSVVLKGVHLLFECCYHDDIADGATAPDVKELMWDYIGDDDDDEKQECETDDTVRREIKEVMRIILTTPDPFLTDG